MQLLYLLADRVGLFFFYFFTLLMLQAGAFLAYTLQNRFRDGKALPILISFASALLLHFLLLIAIVLAPAFGVQTVTLLPPLERLVGFASLALFIWAFASLTLHPTTRHTLLLLTLALALFIYLADALTWPSLSASQEYNTSVRALVWGLSSAFLGFGGALGALLGLGEPLSVGFFLALSLGHLLQALNPQGLQGMPLWVRWAELVAYPLLLLPLLRDLSSLPQPEESPQAAEALSFVKFYEAAYKGTFSIDLPVVMENVAVGIAKALNMPISFVLLMDEENPDLAHVAVFSDGGVKKFKLNLPQNPFLEEALRLSEPALIHDYASLRAWEQILGLKLQTLALSPIVSRGATLGLTGACSPEYYPLPEWQLKLLRTIAGEMRLAMERARIYHSLERKIEDLSWEIRNKEKLITRYESLLKEAKEQRAEESQEIFDRVAFLEERTKELEAALEKARQEAEELKAQAMAESAKAKALQEQLKSLVEKGKPSDEFLNSIPIGLIVADATGKVSWCNETAEELLGWPLKEFSGQPLSSLSDSPQWLAAVEKILAGESRAIALLEIGKKTLRAELAHSGSNVFLTLSDVTAEVEAARNKDRLMASLASDIRNPLTIIIGYTDLLLSESVGLVGEMQRRFLLKIKAAVEKLHKFVNDLLNLAALESGSFSLKFTLVEVEELLGETMALVRAQMEAAGVKLEAKVQEGLPPIEVDFDSIRYTLSTLLSNAIACSPPGSTVRVEITAEPPEGKPDFLKVAVTDAGGGIASEDLSAVFTRFAFPNQSLIRGLGEKGVGLSLVKTLVELHGGRIWAESTMGVGTTFFVLLPFRQENSVSEGKGWEKEDTK